MEINKTHKLLITGDWHLGKTYHGYSLLPFQERILLNVVEIANREEVHGFIITGDVYDKRRPSAEEMKTLERILDQVCAIPSVRYILVVAGNHDGDVLTLYAPLFQKYTSEGKTIRFVGKNNWEEALKQPVLSFNGFDMYALPYVERSLCLRWLNAENIQMKEADTRSPLDFLLEYWIGQLSNSHRSTPEKVILFTHMLVAKDNPEEGTDELVGQMMPVHPDTLSSLKAVITGHHHRSDRVRSNIWLVGAPYHLSPEDNYQPAVVLMQVDHGNIVCKHIDINREIFRRVEIKSKSEIEKWLREEYSGDYLYLLEVPQEMVNDVHEAVVNEGESMNNVIVTVKWKESENETPQNRTGHPVGEGINRMDPLSLMQLYIREVHGKELTQKEKELLRKVLEKT